MADKQLQVELVAADRVVWSGAATRVIARTTEGDVGVLPGHAPLLSTLVNGVVDIESEAGETYIAAVDAGFLSVAGDRVSILSERAELAHDIDLEAARREVERSRDAGQNDDDARERVARAEARIRAVELSK